MPCLPLPATTRNSRPGHASANRACPAKPHLAPTRHALPCLHYQAKPRRIVPAHTSPCLPCPFRPNRYRQDRSTPPLTIPLRTFARLPRPTRPILAPTLRAQQFRSVPCLPNHSGPLHAAPSLSSSRLPNHSPSRLGSPIASPPANLTGRHIPMSAIPRPPCIHWPSPTYPGLSFPALLHLAFPDRSIPSLPVQASRLRAISSLISPFQPLLCRPVVPMPSNRCVACHSLACRALPRRTYPRLPDRASTSLTIRA